MSDEQAGGVPAPDFDPERVIRLAVEIVRLAALQELGQDDTSEQVDARLAELLAEHGVAALLHAARVWSLAIAETLALDVADDGTAFALFDLSTGQRIHPDDSRLDPAFVWALRFHAACVNSDRDAAIALFAAMLEQEQTTGGLRGDGLRWLVRLAGRADTVKIEITAARSLAGLLSEVMASNPGEPCHTEPGAYAIVTDRNGLAWQRRPVAIAAGREWFAAGREGPVTWDELAGTYGPVALRCTG